MITDFFYQAKGACSLIKIQSLADELALIENGSEFVGARRSEPDGAAVGSTYEANFKATSPCESDVWPGSSDSGRDSSANSPEEIASHPSFDGEKIASSTYKATHRGLHKFTARHADELAIDIGDPINVIGDEDEDLDGCWCRGINLRTNKRGLFPLAYVVDVNYDFDDEGQRRLNKERYASLNYLGSLETALSKGEQVITSALEKIRSSGRLEGASVQVEITDQGLHVVTDDSRMKPDVNVYDSFLTCKFVKFNLSKF